MLKSCCVQKLFSTYLTDVFLISMKYYYMKYYRFVKIAFYILVITFSNSLQSQCYELVWSDEFNYNGFPASSKWKAETGGGGWGNNELQFYTNDTANAYVENGRL